MEQELIDQLKQAIKDAWGLMDGYETEDEIASQLVEAMIATLQDDHVIAPKDWRVQVSSVGGGMECPVCGEWW